MFKLIIFYRTSPELPTFSRRFWYVELIDLYRNKEGKFRGPAQVINQSFHFNISLLSRMLVVIMNINLGTRVAFVVLFHTRRIKLRMLSPSSTPSTMLDTSSRNDSRDSTLSG